MSLISQFDIKQLPLESARKFLPTEDSLSNNSLAGLTQKIFHKFLDEMRRKRGINEKAWEFYQENFLPKNIKTIDKNGHPLSPLLNAIENKILKINDRTLLESLDDFQKLNLYHIPKHCLHEIMTFSRSLSKENFSLIAVADESPRDNTTREMNLEKFVKKFNSSPANLDENRNKALEYLMLLKNQTWKNGSRRNFPKPMTAQAGREGFFILFGCNDFLIKKTAIELLIDLLEVDPITIYSSGGLVDLQHKIMEAMNPLKAQSLPTLLQQKMIKAYALTLECILLQASLGRLNAIEQETKDAIWEAAEGFLNLNLKDPEINYWAHFAVQAAQNLRSDATQTGEWIGRFSILTTAFFTVASAVHYPDYVATAISAGPALISAFGQLRGLLYHIEWKEGWFKKVLVVMKICRFAMHDFGEFQKILPILQEQKMNIALEDKPVDMLVDVYIVNQEKILFAIVIMLESIVVHTTCENVRESCMKLLLQYCSINIREIQFRVVKALLQMLQAEEKLANTAYIALRFLIAGEAIHFESVSQLIEQDPLMVSYPTESFKKSIAVKEASAEGMKEIYYPSIIRYMIIRLAEVRDMESQISEDLEGKSLATLLVCSYNEQVVVSMMEVINDLFTLSQGPSIGFTPFHLAVIQKRPKMITHLCKWKDIFNVDGQDQKGQTPLHLAVEKNDEKLIQELLKCKANPNIFNEKGYTPLHLAVLNGSCQIVKVLLHSQADPNLLTLQEGFTSLDLAIRSDEFYIYTLLKEFGGAISEESGATDLMQSAKEGAETILKNILIKYKAANQKLDPREALTLVLLISKDGITSNCSKSFLDFHNEMLEDYPHYSQIFERFKKNLINFDTRTLLIRKESSSHGSISSTISIPDPLNLFGNTRLIALAKASSGIANFRRRMLQKPKEINRANHFGLTPLHIAVIYENHAAIDLLLSNGAEVNAKDKRGFTPLHFAAMTHSYRSVKRLCSVPGIDKNCKNDFGDTPFLVSCGLRDQHYPHSIGSISSSAIFFRQTKEHKDAFYKSLIPEGCDIDTTDTQGNSPLHHAVHTFSPFAMEWLANNCPSLFWKKNKRGLIPLEEAIFQNSPLVIEALITSFLKKFNFSELNNELILQTNQRLNLPKVLALFELDNLLAEMLRQNPELSTIRSNSLRKDTPLELAARLGITKVLDVYLGLNLPIGQKDLSGNTIAHIAAYNSRYEFLQKIPLDHPIFSQSNNDGRLPSQIAADRCFLKDGQNPILEFLLQNNLSQIKHQDHYGNSLLHTVCKIDCIQNMQTLINIGKEELDFNLPNDEGNTPLHLAAAFNHTRLIDLLHKNNANLEAKNIHGLTPFLLAAQQGNVEAVRQLASLGANLYAFNVELEGALHLAAHNLHVETVKELFKLEEMMIRPPSFRSLANRFDIRDESALLEFPKNALHDNKRVSDALEIFKMLIKAGIPIHRRNEDGEHLVHILAANSDPVILHYLFKSKDLWFVHDLDINVRDHMGSTPLHKAAHANHYQMVRMLLEIGADPNMKDHKGRSPLMLAVKQRCHTVWQELLKCKNILLIMSDNENKNVLHYLFENSEPLNQRELLFCLELLKRSPSLLKKRDSSGKTPLHTLAENGHGNALDHLMQCGSMSPRDYEKWVYRLDASNNTAADLASPELASKIRSYPKEHLGAQYNRSPFNALEIAESAFVYCKMMGKAAIA